MLKMGFCLACAFFRGGLLIVKASKKDEHNVGYSANKGTREQYFGASEVGRGEEGGITALECV